MKKSEFPNIDIDELLNSFVDGELDQRHQTEVQRLIKHNEQIAERLQKIQKCKRLVSSLPYAEAPKEVPENIKAALQEKDLIAYSPRGRQFGEYEGAKHLLLRRLTAAAAMIGLVAVLAAVIYSIVAPEPTIDKPVAVEKWRQPDTQQPRTDVIVATAEKPTETGLAETEFNGKLVLKTGKPSEVVAFINSAIERNTTPATIDGPKGTYTLTCTRQNLSSLMADLGNIWYKLDSATLFVKTDQPEGQIVVDAVAPEQIIEIANQDRLETQIKAAQYFAALNNITELTPGKEVDDSSRDLTTIPKPVLTSSQELAKKAADTEKQKVSLTIVVTGSE